MPPQTFKCFSCWDPARIGLVINKEAVSLDRANFLATHVPLDNLRYERAPHAIGSLGEDGLRHELVGRSQDDQHSFVVVQGIPGSGKSHLIRWLKEQYWSELGESDVVLLIERAQCTLRGSIEQIIRSGVLDGRQMQNQLKLLQTATIQLSSEALADNILNQLHVVAVDSASSASIESLGRNWRTRLNGFLLDRTIRAYLKRPGGPVERIRRYLAQGPDAGISAREEPRFRPVDFDLPDHVVNALRKEAYRDTLDLAKDLQSFPNRRVDLSAYLNRLLDTAVGRMTALSADDLKSIFADLRRELRRQGRGLALFIEDITAFTGIDAGLVDVLATQHTGEANTEFCRLLSVIGVTDSYFHDHFPTNIQDRITHRLSLNAPGSGLSEMQETEFLRDTRALEQLTARYLNAMRLSQEQLEGWSQQDGARPELLPNACRNCPFSTPCHAAFGSAGLPDGESSKEVGLYPFNSRALVTMYGRLRNTARTPRSFLQSVLAYVLQSHGPEIEAGRFPPRAAELSADVRPPALRFPGQQVTIQQQADSMIEADRIESLLLFWGDGTAYASSDERQRMLGSVPEGVFAAFDVRFIPGEARESENTPPPLAGPTVPVGYHPEHLPSPAVASPPVEVQRSGANATTRGPTSTASTKGRTSYREDIDQWRQGGKLQQYTYFASRLVALFRSAIDWGDYAATPADLDERLQNQRIVLEDQVGQKSVSDHLHFARSPEMSLVLHALAYFGEQAAPDGSPEVAGHLARLSTFVASRRQTVVDFVLQRGNDAAEHIPQAEVVVLDAVMLEALAGGLTPELGTPGGLLRAILARCADGTKWSSIVDAVAPVRPQAWTELLRKGFPQNPGADLRRHLIAVLNRPQGDVVESQANPNEGGRRVYFLDVALALRALRSLEERDWVLSPLSGAQGDRETGVTEAEKVYISLRKQFIPVIDEQRQQLLSIARDLTETLGSGPLSEAVDSVKGVLQSLHAHQQGYDRTLDDIPDATALESDLRAASRIGAATSRGELVLALSGAGSLMQALRRCRHYYNRLSLFLKERDAQLTERSCRLTQQSMVAQLASQVESAYAGDRARHRTCLRCGATPKQIRSRAR